MPNELALTFEATRVRVVMIDDVPWWVLTDVCAVLEIGNAPQAASRLDEDEKHTIYINDSAGGPERIIISEPGLYKLLQTSRKPQAKRFDRWVRHEVLPEVRKTGSYRGALPTLNEFGQLLDTKLEPVHRGMMQMRDDIAEVKGNVAEVQGNVFYLSKRVDDMAPRHDFTANTQRMWIYVVAKFNVGKCPCCRETVIVRDGKKIERVAHPDHFHGRERHTPQDGWLVCARCNYEMAHDAQAKEIAKPHFRVFQDNLQKVFGTKAQQSARKRNRSKTVRNEAQPDLFG